MPYPQRCPADTCVNSIVTPVGAPDSDGVFDALLWPCTYTQSPFFLLRCNLFVRSSSRSHRRCIARKINVLLCVIAVIVFTSTSFRDFLATFFVVKTFSFDVAVASLSLSRFRLCCWHTFEQCKRFFFSLYSSLHIRILTRTFTSCPAIAIYPHVE